MVQWTKESLEIAENLPKKLHQNQLVPLIGVKQSLKVESNQTHVI
jgi:hypothetical protein